MKPRKWLTSAGSLGALLLGAAVTPALAQDFRYDGSFAVLASGAAAGTETLAADAEFNSFEVMEGASLFATTAYDQRARYGQRVGRNQSLGFDLDCRDLSGPVQVGGYDPHNLDADRDGVGCEAW